MATRRRTVKPPAPSTQAAGDAAVAAGMSLVPGTGLAADLETYVNETRDYVATYATRQGKLIDIWVQSAAPAHAANRIWIKF